MRSIFLGLLFAFFITNAFGQKIITGKVYSVINNLPVKGISVRISDKQFASTDSAGTFTFTTKKSKIRLIAEFAYSDTTLFVKDIKDTVRLFVYAPIDSLLAQYDVLHNSVHFFCGGGIAPLAMRPSDENFESIYGVKYYLFDCVMPEINQLISYNKFIAAYLDKKYGTNWQKDARPGIWGVTRETKWQE